MLKVVGASWFQTRISTYLIAGMIILGIVSLFIGEIERVDDDNNFAATVYWSPKTSFKIEFWGQGNELEEIPKGAARAYYRSDVKENGWSKLEIESNKDYVDWVQAFAAGLLEGALTWQMIHWQWQNTIESRCEKAYYDCKKIRDLLKENAEKVRARSLTNEQTFWHQINLFYHQLDGMAAGYNYIVRRNHNDEFEIPLEDFIWMNSFSDVSTIERIHNITNGAKPGNDLPGLAAAFIRLVPDKQTERGPAREKIIVGHNSAGSYNTMLRIMKRYKLHYHKTVVPSSASIPGTSVVFAGYPGAISSQDDMYVVTGPKHHRLVITGTTINNFNSELWSKINLGDHALIGPRVMAANRLANTAMEWVRSIARVNSGTTSAQWSILNLAKLALLNASTEPAPAEVYSSQFNSTPEHSLHRFIHTTIDEDLKSLNFSLWRTLRRRVLNQNAPGLLWTAEQIPGLTHAADQSIYLRSRGYWADYGIPHYMDIRDLSGIKKMELKYGNIYSLSSSPRAILFKNGFETANSADSVTHLMRSNHFINNPDSNVVPTAANLTEEIDSEDIVSNTKEVDKFIHSLKTVKNHIVSKDSDGVASILTKQEQEAITSQVNEILKQLESSEESNDSESKENLNLDSTSIEDADDKEVEEGAWHGLGARGDLHGWIGEERYGLLPLGVIDTKVFNATAGGENGFLAISGPAFTQMIEKPIESLLTRDTRSKTEFSFKQLFKRIRQSNLRFVSESESSESEERIFTSSEELEDININDALENVVNRTIQIYAPNAVPPFEWSDKNFATVSHVGHPEKWRFGPVRPTWVW